MREFTLPPLPVELRAAAEAELNISAGNAVRVNVRTGQLEPFELDRLKQVTAPADLADSSVVAFRLEGGLRAVVPVRYGLQMNWVGEAAPGKLTGHIGVRTDLAAQAQLEVSLAGSLLGYVWLEQDRLRLWITRSHKSAAALDARVQAGGQSLLPEAVRDWIAALAGSHPSEWLQRIADEARAGKLGETALRLFQLWDALDERTAAALWKAASTSEALEAFHSWVQRLASLDSPQALRGLLEGKLPEPVREWVEDLSGSLLRTLTDDAIGQKLLAAARAAEAVLGEASRAELLRQLRLRAAQEMAQAPAAKIPDGVGDFVRSLAAKALHALENKLRADLTYYAAASVEETALFDGWFDFSPAGIEAFAAALGGDLTAALQIEPEHGGVNLGLLSHGIRQESRLELGLPFLDRKRWSARLESLAELRVETTPDGRLLSYTVQAEDELAREGVLHSVMSLCGAIALRPKDASTHFSVSYSDRRQLSGRQARSVLAPLLAAYHFEEARAWLESVAPEAQQVVAELTLSVPGEMLAAWLEAPVERSPNYGPVYTEVSVAVQQAMRTWLPYVYFSDLSRYDTPGAAYPLVVYQCTLPFRSKSKNEFAYDVMSAESVAVARRSTGWALAGELARIEQLLVAAGKADTARFYRPSRKDVILAAVERSPRLLNALLLADAQFIDQLIRLGVKAGGLRRAMEREPQRAVRDLAKFGAEFVKTFHRRLRRLYGGQDFVSFGALILVEATRALNAALKSAGGISGLCRLQVAGKDGASVERTFVNADYRPA